MPKAQPDWLLNPKPYVGKLVTAQDGRSAVLTNGLVSRTFTLSLNAATTGLDNLMTGEALLRAIEPEATVVLNGKSYNVGGLVGQPDRAYLKPEWLAAMKADPEGFRLESWSKELVSAHEVWKRVRHAEDHPWPPKGAGLVLRFAHPAYPGLVVSVHHVIYNGIPLLGKWIEIDNKGSKPVHLDRYSNERLALVEGDSMVDQSPDWQKPNLTPLTDYSFGGMSLTNSQKGVRWTTDPAYTTQVNYDLKTPCLLEGTLPLGPSVDIPQGGHFESHRVYELIHDNQERERQSLAVRKAFRILSPWVTENPIMLHLTSTDPKTVHTAIDQAAACGFEMVIISFWSGLDMEDVSDANIAKFKEFREYANSKGLELGGYSLLASRKIDDADDVIDPATGKTGHAIFGNSPCLLSKWGEAYFQKIQTFISKTGFSLLEHDGSYPGDVCASTSHPGHKGLDDSQWLQWVKIRDFYRWCRERGVYLNVPDHYYLAGSNKSGMGYRETNWSLPRDQQHIHARQNLYDGTWDKTPSMGWMMVPLVEYQGGGPAATIEPLKDHLQDYSLHLANNFGYGAQACYRGYRLYDSPETEKVVVKWVSWFKKYRDILESDVIHVRRADGRRLDCVLHVNPGLPVKGMAVVYNPSDHVQSEEIELPLYYTGLTDKASVSREGGVAKAMPLDRGYKVRLNVQVQPRSCTWYTIR